MFDDVLLESAGRVKTRRGLTTLLSLCLQTMLIAALALLPLLHTEALPEMARYVGVPLPPHGEAPPPPEQRARSAEQVVSEIQDGRLIQPTSIPDRPLILTDPEPPQLGGSGHCLGCVPGGVPDGAPDGVIHSILSETPRPAPVAPPPPERPYLESRSSLALLVRQIKPVYPPLALRARIQGDVELHAVISKDGQIQNLRVVSGHPMLVRAAVDAVQQWRYRPYILNGQPIEVETQVTVQFRLNR